MSEIEIIPPKNQHQNNHTLKNNHEDIKIIEMIHIVANIISGGFLGVIAIGLYLLVKKDITPEIRNICYDIVNFNLSFIIYVVIAYTTLIVLIGFVLVPVTYILWFMLMILGAIKHFAGERYEYPSVIKFIQ